MKKKKKIFLYVIVIYYSKIIALIQIFYLFGNMLSYVKLNIEFILYLFYLV